MKIQKKQEIEFFGTKTGNANSIALGYATETKNFGEVAVGIMNKSTAAKDPNSSKGVCVDPDATLFSVGCGGSGERKNALEVKGDGSVIIPGENGNINIADKIKQAFDADASIELVKSAENSLQYTLMVNDEPRGSINIPKDRFLKNVTYDSEGKQLVFTFVTLDEDEHVERVPVGDLKDVYKAGDGITINDDNVISADFSSVMTAISDEKTQRETSDNEIKSTLDTKADKTSIPTKFSNLQNDSVKIETIKGDTTSKFNLIYKESDILRSKLSYDTTNKNTAIAELSLKSFDSTGSYLSQIRMRPENNSDDGQYIIQIQDVAGEKVNHVTSITTQDIQNADYENNAGILIGSGGLEFYDLTNAERPISVITKDGITKKDGKSTEVFAADGSTFDLTTKADASAVPTKVSQLTNDCNFVTVDDNATFAGLTVHNNAQIRFIQKYRHDGVLTYLIAETPADRVANKVFAADGSLFDAGKAIKQIVFDKSEDGINIQAGYITFGGEYGYKILPVVTTECNGIMTAADKVKLDGMQALIDAKANKDDVLQINHPSDQADQITFGDFHLICNKATNSTILSFGEEYLTREDFAKINALPSITGKLSNITAATTAEDMITKFNDLLADLKAKGYMTADVTA